MAINPKAKPPDDMENHPVYWMAFIIKSHPKLELYLCSALDKMNVAKNNELRSRRRRRTTSAEMGAPGCVWSVGNIYIADVSNNDPYWTKILAICPMLQDVMHVTSPKR
jgi:hypothetical protein